MEKNFPELSNYKQTASRRYEKGDKPDYLDNWWFKFMEDDLNADEFIIFAGALDCESKEFKILKVPTEFLKSNKDKIDINSKGWTILIRGLENEKELALHIHTRYCFCFSPPAFTNIEPAP